MHNRKPIELKTKVPVMVMAHAGSGFFSGWPPWLLSRPCMYLASRHDSVKYIYKYIYSSVVFRH